MRKFKINKQFKIAISSLVALTLGGQSFVAFNQQQAREKQLVFACNTEEECQNVIEAAKQRHQALEKEQKEIEAKSAGLKEQVENLVAQLELYQTEIIVTNMELSKLKTQQGNLTVSIESNKEKIKNRLIETQLSLETNKSLQIIATSTSITDFIEKMQVINDLSEADNQIIKTLIEQIKQLKENETKQVTHLGELQTLTSEAENLRQTKKSELDKYVAEVQQKALEQANASSEIALSEQQKKELEEAKVLANKVEAAAETPAIPPVQVTPSTPGASTPSTPTPSNPTPSTPTPSNPTPAPAPTPSNPTPAPAPTPVAPQPGASDIVSIAQKYIGVPYVWGGSTPSGFDCSGFTSYVYREATGKNIGRVTTNQENAGTIIPLSQAAPGDLVFWGSRGGTYHVGIYIGNNQVIHAPYPGRSVEIENTRYFTPDFAVRVA